MDSPATDKKSIFATEAKRNSSKLNERTGNAPENKGPLLETSELVGNVYESKGLNFALRECC
jgi:hypothetical protein